MDAVKDAKGDHTLVIWCVARKLEVYLHTGNDVVCGVTRVSG